ncbi:MAG: gliding motility lipoprotein GldJ [Ichthyobacteriaceae bacterium]|nr:gliding motility lipoprotein GldJ [Ichthyobacteriaceae bacterium]
MKLLNRLKLRNIALLTLTVSMLFACGGGGGSNQSSTTGWNINDSENGGFYANTDYYEQETGPGLVYVEGGAFTMGRVQDDFMHDWNNTPTKQHVRSFFIDETEVTNISYKEYLYWLKRVFPTTEENYKYIYSSALPDTLVWRNRLGANEVYVDNYLRHPAYNQYPVVGVNWIQASKFCVWRTDRVNERILIDKGILNQNNGVADAGENGGTETITKGENYFSTNTYLENPEKVFGGNQGAYKEGLPDFSSKTDKGDTEGSFVGRHANREDGLLMPKYRLPSESEWEYAALALVGNREYNSIKGRKKFPWNGKSAKSDRRRTKGDLLANFKMGRGDYQGIAGWSSDGADITNQVKSYPPNDFGIYDMAGNVAEWVADVYRPMIDDDANDFSYFRGNVFDKKELDENGETILVTSDNIAYDTLSDGALVPRRLPGEISRVTVNSNDTYMRNNYDQADNINYEDGDFKSSIQGGVEGSKEKKEKSGRYMYNAPLNNTKLDEKGNLIKQYDKSDKRTSLINDKVRVYKGGSWADRVYWLDPAQRRFLQQDVATNFIGFRCAMDKVGHKINANKTPYHK